MRREIETHARLRHSCVVGLRTPKINTDFACRNSRGCLQVQLLQFFEDSSCIYIVMQLCEGGPLSNLLARQGGGV